MGLAIARKKEGSTIPVTIQLLRRSMGTYWQLLLSFVRFRCLECIITILTTSNYEHVHIHILYMYYSIRHVRAFSLSVCVSIYFFTHRSFTSIPDALSATHGQVGRLLAGNSLAATHPMLHACPAPILIVIPSFYRIDLRSKYMLLSAC